MELEGNVARVVYRNPTNGYSVLRLKSLSNEVSAGEVTAVGFLPAIREGDKYRLKGEWKEHPKWGRQFAFAEHEIVMPETRAGIVRYLASLTYGVGEAKAQAIVDALGENALDVIREDPTALSRVKGINPLQAKEIVEAICENAVLAELSSLVCREGITPRLAAQIYARYGPESVRVVRENPYVLAGEIFGVGFKVADRIAQAVHIAPDSPYRIKAATLYALKDATNDGHCYLLPQELIKRAKGLLTPAEISGAQIKEAVDTLEREGEVINEDNRSVYLAKLHQAETYLAAAVQNLLARPKLATTATVSTLLTAEEGRNAIEYADQQRAAVIMALTEPLSIITGGPGTGKSTVTKAIVDLYGELRPNAPIYLASPTGRAAKRLAECTGLEAKTIHRLLRYNPELGSFVVNADNPLDPGLLVVDEFSMCDVELAQSLFAAANCEGMQIVLVGDADQLPSVGPGNVLHDLIAGGVPTTELVYNFRQASGSMIAYAAQEIRAGRVQGVFTAARAEDSDIDIQVAPNPETAAAIAKLCVRQALENGLGPLDFQVLCPMHKGEAGVAALNRAIREIANPPLPGQPEFGGYRPGDKVMVIKNDYDKGVFNGDLGLVSEVRPQGANAGITVKFVDGEAVAFCPDDLNELTPAYASTIHKAQGSEFPLCIVLCMRQHWIMLQRNLLYTAVTRAKGRLVLICQEEAVEQAVKNGHVVARHGKLKDRIAM